MKQFALITGASQGLGKSFALELDGQKINTILVSLPGENLEKVSEACKDLGVDSYYFETDLRKKKNIIKLGKTKKVLEKEIEIPIDENIDISQIFS